MIVSTSSKSGSPPAAKGGTIFRAGWSLLKRHRVEVLLVTVCLMAGVAYFGAVGLSYTCAAKLCLWPERLQDLTGGAERVDNTVLQTQCELISSAAILKPVLNDPEMRNLPILASATDPLEFLRDSLRVRAGRQDRIVTVGLQSRHRNRPVGLLIRSSSPTSPTVPSTSVLPPASYSTSFRRKSSLAIRN